MALRFTIHVCICRLAFALRDEKSTRDFYTVKVVVLKSKLKR
jgi:hypothetical protein